MAMSRFVLNEYENGMETDLNMGTDTDYTHGHGHGHRHRPGNDMNTHKDKGTDMDITHAWRDIDGHDTDGYGRRHRQGHRNRHGHELRHGHQPSDMDMDMNIPIVEVL
jgi:hypothetical protein